jgi:hypothetical protein
VEAQLVALLTKSFKGSSLFCSKANANAWAKLRPTSKGEKLYMSKPCMPLTYVNHNSNMSGRENER